MERGKGRGERVERGVEVGEGVCSLSLATGVEGERAGEGRE